MPEETHYMFRKKKKPVLSVVIAFYNMEREAPRTLYTLSSAYQRGVSESDYEVIAVDCGSDTPLDEAMVRSFGKQFRLVRMPPNPSPAASINRAAMSSRGKLITICIDGARMLSPGILRLMLASFQSFKTLSQQQFLCIWGRVCREKQYLKAITVR